MDQFDKIWNEILKEEDNNHEAIYKSRLKKKYKAFLEGNNTDMLCKMIQAYSINKTIVPMAIVAQQQKEEKKIEVIETVGSTEEIEHIKKLTRENNRLKHRDNSTWEHKHNNILKEFEDYKIGIKEKLIYKDIEIKLLKKKLANYGDEDYMDYL